MKAKAYQRVGQVVVEGAEGQTETFYDAVGRTLERRSGDGEGTEK